MPAISLKKFSGEIPRQQAHLLPDGCAQLCENVDLVDGSLTPMRTGLLLRGMLSNPVRGIFTLDGINFYTWSTETLAFRSPIIDDQYNRFYFLQPGGNFNVGSTLQMAFNGPSPSSNVYRAGVPKADTAPALSLIEMTQFIDYPNASISATAWYSAAGTEYAKNSVSIISTQPLRSFAFTVPAKPEKLPEGVVLCCQFIYKDQDGAPFLTLTIRAGETARSNAIPGTVEADLSVNGNTATIKLSYGAQETRAYTYTFENDIGEEGGAATPSIISPSYVQAVRVVVSTVASTGFRPIQKVNIYRTYGSTATYFNAKLTRVDASTYDDYTNKPTDIGGALESMDWQPSPTALQGIDVTPNGWFVAFRDNMLYMSEPYRPHAWPYSIPFSASIRGVRVARSSVVVTTADGLYVLNGSFPSNAQPMKVEMPQSGIAQRSMVMVDGGVVYASNDGIVMVEGGSATMAAGGALFTRKTWRGRYESALLDASMRFGYHDGCLVMTSKTLGAGFLIRLDEDAGAFSRTTESYDAMFLLPVTDTLYYSVGSNVYRFNTGGALPMDWWSKDFIYPNPVTFGAGRIKCGGPVRMRLYAEGQLVHDVMISNGEFRIKNLLKQLKWSVRLTASTPITEFAIARSMLDLKNV